MPRRNMLLVVQLCFVLTAMAGPPSEKALLREKKSRLSSSFVERGHSHNDYFQAEPFNSAIHHGLRSIEVDVFDRRDGLFIAHTMFELDPKKRIETMYIQPLLTLLKKGGFRPMSREMRVNSGMNADGLPHPIDVRGGTRRKERRDFAWRNNQSKLIGPETGSLILLVDFKGHPEKSTALLEQALGPLQPFLSRITRDGAFRRGKLTVVISGNRPSDEVLLRQHTARHNGNRFLFLDGREKDLRQSSNTLLVPMVSIPWRSMYLARAVGRGEAYMCWLARKAHGQSKLLRIWGAPNDETIWRQMVRSNVDLLSIDDHEKFARFAENDNSVSTSRE